MFDSIRNQDICGTLQGHEAVFIVQFTVCGGVKGALEAHMSLARHATSDWRMGRLATSPFPHEAYRCCMVACVVVFSDTAFCTTCLNSLTYVRAARCNCTVRNHLDCRRKVCQSSQPLPVACAFSPCEDAVDIHPVLVGSCLSVLYALTT